MAAATGISAYQLDCKFESLNYYGPYGHHYSCRGLNFDSFCDDRNITEVVGTHSEQKTDEEVAQFFIDEMHSECVPQLVDAIFVNLKVFAIRKSFLSELHADDLAGLSKLQVLDFADNFISTVPLGFFDHTPNLEQISFYNNKIKKFIPRVVPNFPGLKLFHMGSNVCWSQNAENPRALRELHGLMKVECATSFFQADSSKSETHEDSSNSSGD